MIIRTYHVRALVDVVDPRIVVASDAVANFRFRVVRPKAVEFRRFFVKCSP